MVGLLPGLLNKVYVQMTDKLNDDIRATLAESDGTQFDRLEYALGGFEGRCESWVTKANMIKDCLHYFDDKMERQAALNLAGELEDFARRIKAICA